MNLRLLVLTASCLLMTTSAFAFGPPRLKVAPEFRSFGSLDETGHVVLTNIQNEVWQKTKPISLNFLVGAVKIELKQTAVISFENDVLAIKSAAGDQVAGLNGILNGLAVDYSSNDFRAPVVFKGQKLADDGSIQIAFGVDYLKGIALDKNENKIKLALLKDSAFSLPDSYNLFSQTHPPDFSQYPEEARVQLLVLKWNKNAPRSLSVRGLSEAAVAIDEFETTYTAL